MGEWPVRRVVAGKVAGVVAEKVAEEVAGVVAGKVAEEVAGEVLAVNELFPASRINYDKASKW